MSEQTPASSTSHKTFSTAPASTHPSFSNHQDFSAHDSALSLTTPHPDPTSSAYPADPADTAVHTDHDSESETFHGEEEEVFDDNDSAFGGSLIGCDTDTLASYITDYRYENGRRYHAYQDGEYWVGNSRFSNVWHRDF
jgi:hypothetical protein